MAKKNLADSDMTDITVDELRQEVKKLESELKGLSGSPVVAKAEAVLAHTEEA